MRRHVWTAALLLLASSASSQAPQTQPTPAPAPADPNAAAIPVAEIVPQPLPTLTGTSALPVEGDPAPQQQPQAAPQPEPPAQPASRPTGSGLALSVDRPVARPGQRLTFTVRSAGELRPDLVQLTITRGGKAIRTLQAERDGRYRTTLPLGSYRAQAFVAYPDTYKAALQVQPLRLSNVLSVRVIDPRADALTSEPAAEPEPAPASEPAKPADTQAVPEIEPAPVAIAKTVPSTSWPWWPIAAVALLALAGAVRWSRDRRTTPSEAPPAAPRLTCNTHVTHETSLLTAPSLRFRISARAVPDKGRQHILPPSTPAPKLKDAHGRRADPP